MDSASSAPAKEHSGLQPLLEFASRELDFQDRVFDSLTARAALIYGFATTTALPASVWVLRRLPTLWAQTALGTALLGLNIGLAAFCWLAYRPQAFVTWPKTSKMFQAKLHEGSAHEARTKILKDIALATAANEGTLARKAVNVEHAIACLWIELGLIVLGALFPKCIVLLRSVL